MTPKFSVVIPTYNRADALRHALQTVVEQTLDDFEVIVVDDGSTDETKTTVEQFADTRIRYFWITNSGGPATPRNVGIDEAHGEWIAFLDSDDLWKPTKLEAIERSIRQDDCVDVICNNEEIRRSDGRLELLRYGPVTPNFYKTLLVEGNRCSTSAMTVRKSFIEKHALRFDCSAQYVIVEDYDFWMQLALHGARYRFLDEVLGEYMVGDGGISSNVQKARYNWIRLLEKHVFSVQHFAPDRDRLWRQIRARTYATIAAEDLRLRCPRSFVRNIVRALILSPSSVALWLKTRLLRRIFPR